MCLGSIIHIAMKSDIGTAETLVKFDDFFNVMLGDITEFGIPLEGERITK
ncbi:U6 snRNA-associated Sm-like protein LSm5 [Lemmus lemmus]